MVSSLAAQAATLVEEAPQNGIPTAAMQQVAEVLTQVAQHLDHLQYTTLRYPDGGWLTVRVVERSAGTESPQDSNPSASCGSRPLATWKMLKPRWRNCGSKRRTWRPPPLGFWSCSFWPWAFPAPKALFFTTRRGIGGKGKP